MWRMLFCPNMFCNDAGRAPRGKPEHQASRPDHAGRVDARRRAPKPETSELSPPAGLRQTFNQVRLRDACKIVHYEVYSGLHCSNLLPGAHKYHFPSPGDSHSRVRRFRIYPYRYRPLHTVTDRYIPDKRAGHERSVYR